MTAYETGYDLLAETCRERWAAQFERAAWPPPQPGSHEPNPTDHAPWIRKPGGEWRRMVPEVRTTTTWVEPR